MMSKLLWGAVLLLLRAWSVVCTRVTILAPDDTRAPYLIRWHVWWGIYLHKFVSSDPDRGWHCHPWTWARSRILDGEYFQSVPPGVGRKGRPPERTYRTGDVNDLLEGDYHRVLLRTSVVWTLFKHGPYHGNRWHFLGYDLKTITPPRERDAPEIRRGLVHFV